MTHDEHTKISIDDSAAVDLLTELVSIASPSRQELAASEFLVRSMRALGYEQCLLDGAGNAVGIRQNLDPGNAALRTILLLGHIDTVEGWIAPRVEGGLLYGRGTVDAKGPLAAMTIAAARARLALGVRVIVAGAVEEESATSKGAREIARGHSPDCCVIGEPSGWDAYTIGYKGRLLIDYAMEQDEGHWAGQRTAAAESAITWWTQLQQIVERHNIDRPKLFDQILLSLRDFHTSRDGLRDRVDVRVGLRLPPDFDRVGFEGEATAIAGTARLRFYAFEQAWQSPRTSPLATAFGAAIRGKSGAPRAKLKTGTSDMNVVGPIWRCPIVAYGPGDSALDHSPNEHIKIEEYLRSIDVLQDVLESLGRS